MNDPLDHAPWHLRKGARNSAPEYPLKATTGTFVEGPPAPVDTGSLTFLESAMAYLRQQQAFSLLLGLARALTAEEPLAEDYERHHLYTLARRALDAAEDRPSL